MNSEKILFIPELELDSSQAPTGVTIKGESPQLAYPFTLRDIYPLIPSLSTYLAYQQIQKEFGQLNNLLWYRLKLRDSFHLPPVLDDREASYILSTLFDPTCYRTDRLWQRLTVPASINKGLLQIEKALPFPLRLAPADKLMHTLVWIDTNIKVSVENITKPYMLSASAVQQIVESALKIYSYLIKQKDYQLARSFNFNHSMFLQDRILNLIFGDNIYLATDGRRERGKFANHIALQLLKNLNNLSYRQLCTLSVFMGVIWTSREDMQQAFLVNADITLEHIYTELSNQQKNWCIDHIDQFIADMGVDTPITVVVVLDDNGESVFDIAIFQRLLNDTEMLKVIFVVNRYPISNNIDLNIFQTLLEDNYFADLRQYFKEGRVALCVEEQIFRSFEVDYLCDQTWRAIKNSRATYIKGANFFETFQIPETTRYHCFTVYDRTSMLLTGCTKGSGIFAKLKPGQTGYTYYSHDQIETLKAKVTRQEVDSRVIQSIVGY